jgi:hypothetical protein
VPKMLGDASSYRRIKFWKSPEIYFEMGYHLDFPIKNKQRPKKQ